MVFVYMRSILLLICTLLAVPIVADNTFYQAPPTTEDAQLLDIQRNQNRDSMLCMDIKPQHTLNIQHITGRWFGTEIIMHTQDVPGIYRYDSCVIIHLNDVTAQMRGYALNYNVHNRDGNRQTSPTLQPLADLEENAFSTQQQKSYMEPSATKYLRLVWSEKDDNLEYTFNYTEHSPGYWSNVGDQRGSLVSFNQYTQFTGSVQVVKAVNDHLILTFCGNDMRSSIYTIVLSRNQRGLQSDELRSIRNLLSRRGLSTDSIRQVCVSAAERLSASYLLGVLFMLIINKYRVK